MKEYILNKQNIRDVFDQTTGKPLLKSGTDKWLC